MNFSDRFIGIFRPDFFQNMKKDKKVGQAWGFWFLVNTLFSIGVMVYFFFFSGTMDILYEFNPNEYFASQPDFEISIEDGVLSTNLPEPFVKEFGEGMDTGKFVIDTKRAEYNDKNIILEPPGIYIFDDRFYIKKETGELRSYSFAQFSEGEPISFTKADLIHISDAVLQWIKIFGSIIICIGIWIYICGFRLITALWWALVLWIIAMIGKEKWLTFGKSYLIILHLYIIPLLLESILFIYDISIPFGTTIIFGILFTINIVHLSEKEK